MLSISLRAGNVSAVRHRMQLEAFPGMSQLQVNLSSSSPDHQVVCGGQRTVGKQRA